MKGKGLGVTGSIGNSSGHFFFVWTLIAIGVTGLFSVILSARGLWSLLNVFQGPFESPNHF